MVVSSWDFYFMFFILTMKRWMLNISQKPQNLIKCRKLSLYEMTQTHTGHIITLNDDWYDSRHSLFLCENEWTTLLNIAQVGVSRIIKTKHLQDKSYFLW